MRKSLILYGFLALNCFYACSGSDTKIVRPPLIPIDASGTECGEMFVQELIDLNNQARTAKQLAPLTCDNGLTLAAKLHAQDMCVRNFFDHITPDGVGYCDRIKNAGVNYTACAEVIDGGKDTPQQVHASFIGSPTHRDIILNSLLHRVGVGYMDCRPINPNNKFNYNFWVENFTD